MLQRLGFDPDGMEFPFFTPRAMLWNIKTLGFFWWMRCLAQNMRATLVEQYRAQGQNSSSATRAR